MIAIKVLITKFISNDQPGFVECVFTDAWGKEHIIHEKIPVITSKDLNSTSIYPQDGEVACEIIKEWNDEDGRKIISVITSKPWGIETVNGVQNFDLLKNQVFESKSL